MQLPLGFQKPPTSLNGNGVGREVAEMDETGPNALELARGMGLAIPNLQTRSEKRLLETSALITHPIVTTVLHAIFILPRSPCFAIAFPCYPN
jgi:hypothetical protein